MPKSQTLVGLDRLRKEDAQRRRTLQAAREEQLRKEELDRLRLHIEGEGVRRHLAQEGIR